MSAIKTGGSAFPRQLRDYEPTNSPCSGMTLRDYFAAKAMAGILSGPCTREGVGRKEWLEDIPRDAYAIADVMLAAREVQP